LLNARQGHFDGNLKKGFRLVEPSWRVGEDLAQKPLPQLYHKEAFHMCKKYVFRPKFTHGLTYGVLAGIIIGIIIKAF
jgi:hypothetical protein